ADWSSKPNALAYNDLVFREWWTNVAGVSNSAGRFATRGFKGSYNVTAVYGRTSQTVTATIDQSGELTIMLDVAAPRAPIVRGGPRQIEQ
ncbi:MAG TPA: hypothetical protein PLK30_10400, partial [Blastocatellia bacterium]|nr:hypothetical protein [Blastocatellia bacterium]